MTNIKEKATDALDCINEAVNATIGVRHHLVKINADDVPYLEGLRTEVEQLRDLADEAQVNFNEASSLIKFELVDCEIEADGINDAASMLESLQVTCDQLSDTLDSYQTLIGEFFSQRDEVLDIEIEFEQATNSLRSVRDAGLNDRSPVVDLEGEVRSGYVVTRQRSRDGLSVVLCKRLGDSLIAPLWAVHLVEVHGEKALTWTLSEYFHDKEGAVHAFETNWPKM